MTYIVCNSIALMAYYISEKGGVLCRERAHMRLSLPLKRGGSWRKSPGDIRHHIVMSFAPRLPSLLPRDSRTKRSVNALSCPVRWSRSGESAFSRSAWPDWLNGHGVAARAFSPPEIVVEVKALACQLPKDLGLPFSRLSREEIARQAVNRGIVASISGATVWRWLTADAIRPWCYRSWIRPRDPDFEQKAGAVLDLYHGVWKGKSLDENEYVICADEKTSIQARQRVVPTTPPGPGRAGRVEHEYKRQGALAYLAAWDVRRAKVFGLCQPTNGIESFRSLVDLVMGQEPYCSARRVFWVTDNGSSHRGRGAINRLHQWHPNALLVHTPIHASWLNQIEIYFSVVQRTVLTPNDVNNLDELIARLLAFQSHYETTAEPFEWKFTRNDLKLLLKKLSGNEQQQQIAA